jgi:hypothetical protein
MDRIGLEAGPLSQWLYASMGRAGLAVELLETRHMRAAYKTFSHRRMEGVIPIPGDQPVEQGVLASPICELEGEVIPVRQWLLHHTQLGRQARLSTRERFQQDPRETAERHPLDLTRINFVLEDGASHGAGGHLDQHHARVQRPVRSFIEGCLSYEVVQHVLDQAFHLVQRLVVVCYSLVVMVMFCSRL